MYSVLHNTHASLQPSRVLCLLCRARIYSSCTSVSGLRLPMRGVAMQMYTRPHIKAGALENPLQQQPPAKHASIRTMRRRWDSWRLREETDRRQEHSVDETHGRQAHPHSVSIRLHPTSSRSTSLQAEHRKMLLLCAAAADTGQPAGSLPPRDPVASPYSHLISSLRASIVCSSTGPSNRWLAPQSGPDAIIPVAGLCMALHFSASACPEEHNGAATWRGATSLSRISPPGLALSLSSSPIRVEEGSTPASMALFCRRPNYVAGDSGLSSLSYRAHRRRCGR